jgi:CubicO group peptidase (beta-lactamase class C family)
MRLTPPYNIFSFIFLILLIACHSESQPVTARPAHGGGKFREEPPKPLPLPLTYDTSGPVNAEIIAKLDNYYRAQVRAGFNGSVLVGRNGKIIYERYFGYGNKERKIPLGPNSSSQLASVSKTFTSAAILYLYDHKYLNIDDPVKRYIPEFPYPNITIRMLLNHRSGLPDYTKWVPNHNRDMETPISNTQMMAMMVMYKPALESRPNTRFKYCNTNFAVLARIVEEISDMSYPDFMKKYIFQPLGMNNTFVYEPLKQELPLNATISYKYNWRREPDMFADGVFGDKGIYSTTQDMFRWDQSFYQNKLLNDQTIELAYLPCSFEKRGVKNYGLGWRMLCYANGNKVIYHNGWWHGNNTSFYRFIKDNMTIVVLGNKFNNAIYHQAPVIYSTVKGVPVEDGFDTEN